MIWNLDERVWTWRMLGGRYFPEFVVSTVKFGVVSLMVSGCFSWFGLGPLVWGNGNMNSEDCVNI